jgi:signal transduction histidine kinase
MFVLAAALLGLIAVLATLQYRWLGRISDAERERMRASANARATAFAQDFDRELTLAYMLFQVEPLLTGDTLAGRVASRYDRWQTTARHPRLIKDCYVASRQGDAARLQRFNPSTRFLEPVDWPEPLAGIRAHVDQQPDDRTGGAPFLVRAIAGPLWDAIPAIVVPAPQVFLHAPGRSGIRFSSAISYMVLVLDRDYIQRDLLPALAQQHFRGTGDGFDYQVAVVSLTDRSPLYRSAAFEPKPDAKVDAAADLFQVRTQEFAQLAADVRRFVAALPPGTSVRETVTLSTPATGDGPRREQPGVGEWHVPADETASRRRELPPDAKPLSIIVQQAPAVAGRTVVGAAATAVTRTSAPAATWRLLVKHPSGSLEAAVNTTRRRNLIVSSTILAVLGASMVLLVISTRRSQEVARQQMEFVAAVSHELRTPLAVIRSAGDNLADGVVGDPDGIRTYGELVRSEGRRLSEMVEQILEFAGIQSGQRRLEPRPVAVSALLQEVLSASASLVDAARMTVEIDVPDDLPAVLGDEPALRRVFQNLVGNAIKYGADGRWIGVRARASGEEVRIAVADRGIGIAPSEQQRIFEPFYRGADVAAAQIQGAGLGLSLVARIVEAHGGRITVTSAPGEGSEFTVHLAAAPPEAAAREADLDPSTGDDRRRASPAKAEAPRYT